MRVALVNPPWTFDGSIYFGCREPHLPIEFGFAKALLERAGHEAEIVDGQLDRLSYDALRARVERLAPEMTVVTTAPSYLFWRCAPPELRVPQETIAALAPVSRTLVAVGPHSSTTPRIALKKLGVDAAVIGECDEVLATLASTPRARWRDVPSIVYRDSDEIRSTGKPYAVDMQKLPALRWPKAATDAHRHHHHRFDREPEAPGAEIEYARGCPYHCTFCAKDNFRNAFRKRPLPVVLDELDALVAQGVRYVYFIDEIFVPDKPLLEALRARHIEFGVQMRIDNWSEPMLDLLGDAGCVSIEAGMESITEEGRSLLAKKCKLSTEELTELLVYAKKRVPFVQANLLDSTHDDPEDVKRWRDHLHANGVWANEPVPMFPYPGSPDYTLRWGAPDDHAWERAHAHYLAQFSRFSDIQETRPRPLFELEHGTDG